MKLAGASGNTVSAVKGLIFIGPLVRYTSCCSRMKACPAMAVPTTTPTRSRSALSRSSFASFTAILAAATAICDVKSIRRDHLASMYGLKSKPFSWAANWVGYGEASNLSTCRMPHLPFLRASQKASLPEPMAVMTPSPVITTLFLAAISVLSVLRSSLPPLERAIPLLGLQPTVDFTAAKPPVLADLSRRNPPILGQGIERWLGDLQVAMELLKGQNVRIQCFHRGSLDTKITTANSCYSLLYNQPDIPSSEITRTGWKQFEDVTYWYAWRYCGLTSGHFLGTRVGWQTNLYDCTVAHAAGKVDSPPMPFHNALHDRKAQTHAAFLGCEKRVPHLVQIFRGDTLPGIRNS